MGSRDNPLYLLSEEKEKTCQGHLDKNKRNAITPSQLKGFGERTEGGARPLQD